ncbi:MAG: diacylglycerol/lipid kinase family protein [Anaerolineae bacterium]
MKLIVNPVAGNGFVGRRWPWLRRRLQEMGADFVADLTEREGHATELARRALDEGHRTIVAVGGDGTVNEVVNGLVIDNGYIHIPSDVTLGIIPGGTGSDLVRTIGIPYDHEKACLRLLKDHSRLIDLGVIEYRDAEGRPRRRLFANAAGMGIDSEIVERLRRGSKLVGGTLPYLITLFRTLVDYKSKDVRACLDEFEFQKRVSSILVLNGRYLAGGMQAAPEASLDDGLFDILVLEAIGRLDLAINIFRVYRGTHLSHPKVHLYRAREVQIESRQRMLIQADGELVGEAPLTLRVIPKALQVRV